MNTLIFHNPGEIDIRGACIAGLSAKESKSPIGYFGTGLKYAIASVLRWDGSISIYSGTTHYSFHTDRVDFRGQEFQQIVMRNHASEFKDSPYGFQVSPLGFTTEYGKDWKPWQVFRELYANARDESGGVRYEPATLRDLVPVAGETIILVSGIPELIESYYDRDEIILPTDKPWSHESNEVQFSPTQASGLYYRGVRVWEQSCLYTWNFLSQLKLTEDRSLSSPMSASYLFDKFLTNDLHNVEVVMQIISLKFEEEPTLAKVVQYYDQPTTLKTRPMECMFMDWFSFPTQVRDYHSEEFQTAAIRLYQRDPTTYSKLRPYIKSLDSKLVEEKLHVMTAREQQMFDKAKELVALFGFEDEINRLPIFVQELGGQTLGLHEHGTIYLSPKLFDQGTKQLVATLYEECYHHRTQNQDCTYNMQSDLFNIIISLNEEIHKVIC